MLLVRYETEANKEVFDRLRRANNYRITKKAEHPRAGGKQADFFGRVAAEVCPPRRVHSAQSKRTYSTQVQNKGNYTQFYTAPISSPKITSTFLHPKYPQGGFDRRTWNTASLPHYRQINMHRPATSQWGNQAFFQYQINNGKTRQRVKNESLV
ncbi:hypothetical protein [Parashewanella curva]|uniref:hypothetical protein n=1 Tax=Parashewanella curva TaxID=2338552 RepID=UPI001059BCA2|nr:hypothetical protein [Parashewanella curva]